jgi:hypothetical protein
MSSKQLLGFDPILLEKRDLVEWVKSDKKDNIVVFLVKKKKTINEKLVETVSIPYCLKRSYFVSPALSDIYVKCVINNFQLNEYETHMTKKKFRNIGFFFNKQTLIDNRRFVKILQNDGSFFMLTEDNINPLEDYINFELLEMSKLALVTNKNKYEKNFFKNFTNLAEDSYFGELISKALHNYSYQWDSAINSYLMQGETYFNSNIFKQYSHRYGSTLTTAAQAVKDKITQIDKCFYELSPRATKKRSTLYRGMKKAYLREDDNTKLLKSIGDVTFVKSYTSVSKSLNVAKGFSEINNSSVRCCMYQIIIPKGMPYIDMKNNSKYPHEQEVLLPRNIRLEVTDILEKKINGNKKYNLYVLNATLVNPEQYKIYTGCKKYSISTIRELSEDKFFKESQLVNKKTQNNKKHTTSNKPKLSTAVEKVNNIMQNFSVVEKLGKSFFNKTSKKGKVALSNKVNTMKRCPDGTMRDTKTGKCISKSLPKSKLEQQQKKVSEFNASLKDMNSNTQNVKQPSLPKHVNTPKPSSKPKPSPKSVPKSSSMNKTKKTCPPGKVLNEYTNNCVKPASLKQYYNKHGKPLPKNKPIQQNKTSKKVNNQSTQHNKTKKKCPPGKVLNKYTNNCVKVASLKQYYSKHGIPLTNKL